MTNGEEQQLWKSKSHGFCNSIIFKEIMINMQDLEFSECQLFISQHRMTTQKIGLFMRVC